MSITSFAKSLKQFNDTIAQIITDTPKYIDMDVDWDVDYEQNSMFNPENVPPDVRELVTDDLINSLDSILDGCNCNMWELDIMSFMVWLTEINELNEKYKDDD
jgi:hypothetical protein